MQQKTTLKDFLQFTLISLIIYFAYNFVSHFITQMPIVSGKRILLIEFPIYLALAAPLFFVKFANPISRYFIPNILPLTLYIIFDTVWKFLSRAPRASDIHNIFAIYEFSPLAFSVIILFALAVITLIALQIYKASKLYSKSAIRKTIVVRLLFIATLIAFLQSPLFDTLQKKSFKYMPWAQESTVKKNGRIVTTLYFSKKEQQNRVILKQQANNTIDIFKMLYPKKLIQKPNIYFVVLESFINPNYIQKIQYNQNPLSKDLAPLLNNGKFSHVISPVYGGNTAQAEFEYLTALPALAKVDTIEFNTFSGKAIDSFAKYLAKNGYQSFATIASGSNFFNSKRAYKSLGFQSMRFLKESPDFKQNPNDAKIFDGDMYQYNLKLIKQHLNKNSQPFFSYALGMYGHIPYERNYKDRPDVIKLLNSKNGAIKRIANQFYYRTKALANYIKSIEKLDPNALILISSDHIPAIINKNTHYKFERHINIALLRYKGKFIDLKSRHQYEVPRFISQILSNQTLPKLDSKTLQKLYYKALYQGSKEP